MFIHTIIFINHCHYRDKPPPFKIRPFTFAFSYTIHNPEIIKRGGVDTDTASASAAK